MAEVIGLKFVHDDQTLSNVEAYIALVVKEDGIQIETRNIDSMNQVAYTAMFLDSMLHEYAHESLESDPQGLGQLSLLLQALSSYLIKNQNKGSVLL